MDLTFRIDQGLFNYRVGAIIVEGGAVLMARNERDAYYYSVGGRVHFGETADQAVRREVQEELGHAPAECHLGFVDEAFFSMDGPCHEIALYFLVSMPTGWAIDPGHRSTIETRTGPVAEWFEWLPITQLGAYRAYPQWFATQLTQPMTGIRHIIRREWAPGGDGDAPLADAPAR